MKKLGMIGPLFILVSLISAPALSQRTSSATHTVMFAVSRSVKPPMNVLAYSQSLNSSSNKTQVILNQLTQESIKVTVYTPSEAAKLTAPTRPVRDLFGSFPGTTVSCPCLHDFVSSQAGLQKRTLGAVVG
jgi:hypothetical protein